jgi:hypothetical protein
MRADSRILFNVDILFYAIITYLYIQIKINQY